VAADRSERVLAVLFELPGPRGFVESRAVGRIDIADALDELAAMDGPTSDDAARAAYEARIADRARRRGGVS